MMMMMVHLRLSVLFRLFTICFVPLRCFFINFPSFVSALAVFFFLSILIELVIIFARALTTSLSIFILITEHRHAIVIRITNVGLVSAALVGKLPPRPIALATVAAVVHGVVVETTWRGKRAKLSNSVRRRDGRTRWRLCDRSVGGVGRRLGRAISGDLVTNPHLDVIRTDCAREQAHFFCTVAPTGDAIVARGLSCVLEIEDFWSTQKF
jgi:hypothetical protein